MGFVCVCGLYGCLCWFGCLFLRWFAGWFACVCWCDWLAGVALVAGLRSLCGVVEWLLWVVCFSVVGMFGIVFRLPACVSVTCWLRVWFEWLVVYLYVWWFVGARFWLFLWIELPIFALIVLDNAMV